MTTEPVIADAVSPAADMVLHVRVVTETGGGPEKTILNSPSHLAKHGYRGLCAYLHPPNDPGFAEIRARADSMGVELISVPDRGAWDLSVVWRLLRICRSRNIGIWHGHDYKSNAIGLLIRGLHRMHLVTTVHGWVCSDWKARIYYRVDMQCLRFYKRVVCVSEALRQTCLKGGVASAQCSLIENSIDTTAWTASRNGQAEQTRPRERAESWRIGTVGRLSPEKGFDTLIAAVDRLIREGRNVSLTIVGEGDARSVLQAQIDRLNLADNVHLAGYQPNTIDLYRSMDVFVLSSLREGLPNVLLEAMAMEVPVVATRVGGVPRIVEDRENGLLIEPNDVDGLVAALRESMDRPEPAAARARCARETIEQDYSFDRRMERMARIYDGLKDGRQRTGKSATAESR